MSRLHSLAAAVALTLVITAPVAAQTTDLSFRPFVMVSYEQFSAETTFEAAFDKRAATFFGGGLNIVQDQRFYLELSASKVEMTGQRAFLSNGQAFRLGIPLTVTITPIELSAGYRFSPRSIIRPYLGAGVGWYKYEETSDFAVEGENVDTRKTGGIIEGGVEVRLHRWFGVAGDVHWTYVPDILGTAGLSKDANEKDLGGFSFRVKVIVGK